MTQRERSLLLVVLTVGGFVLVFGGFIGVHSLLANLDDKDEKIVNLTQEVKSGATQLLVLHEYQRRLDRWKAIGLPPDLGTANARYRSFLQELCRRHRLELVSPIRDDVTRTAPGRGTQMTPLRYTLHVRGTLARVTAMFKDFYSVNIPHQIRDLELGTSRVSGPDTRTETTLSGPDTRLEATLKIEALSLSGTANRESLAALPDRRVVSYEAAIAALNGPFSWPYGMTSVPSGVALGLWSLSETGPHSILDPKLASLVRPERDYSRLASKNIFVGLVPVAAVAKNTTADRNALKYVRLTGVHTGSNGREASLYNQRTNKETWLKSEKGADSFEVRDSNNLLVLNGNVRHIDRRDVVFSVEGKNYLLHVGETLHDAMRKELSDEQFKAFAGSASVSRSGQLRE